MNRQSKGRHVKSEVVPASSGGGYGSMSQAAVAANGGAVSSGEATGTSWTSSTISGSIPVGHHSNHESRYLDVISLVRGSRGPAVAELARYLGKTGMFKSPVDCAELAVQLLAVETEDTCEAVRVLLEDGWESDLGQLLACARKA